MPMLARRHAVCAALLSILPLAAAQDAPPNPHLQKPPPTPRMPPAPEPLDPNAAPAPSAKPSRQEMADAYIRLERAFRHNPPPADKLAEINRSFDLAATAFFTGDGWSAIRTLHRLTDQLKNNTDTPARRIANDLRVKITPAVYTFFANPAPAVRIQSAPAPTNGDPAITPAETNRDIKLSLLLQPTKNVGGVMLNLPAPDAAGRIDTVINLASYLDTIPPDHYEVFITGDDGLRVPVGEWNVVTAPRDVIARSYREQVETQVKPQTPVMKQAVASYLSRVALIKSDPSDAISAEFLVNQYTFENDIIMEKDTLLLGDNPYAFRIGETWRTFTCDGATVPVSIFAPRIVTDGTNMPLVIALHGAGGDEAMFLHGYAAGRLVDLAREKSFIIASPSSYAFTTNPAMLDALIESIALDYNIDRDRIYLIGHSMGSIAASSLAQVRADKIAAAACFAGLRSFVKEQPCAPVLAYAAELDTIIPAARVAAAAQAGKAMGFPIELREVKNYGHALVVSAALDEAVNWLLEHKLLPPAAPPAHAAPVDGAANGGK